MVMKSPKDTVYPICNWCTTIEYFLVYFLFYKIQETKNFRTSKGRYTKTEDTRWEVRMGNKVPGTWEKRNIQKHEHTVGVLHCRKRRLMLEYHRRSLLLLAPTRLHFPLSERFILYYWQVSSITYCWARRTRYVEWGSFPWQPCGTPWWTLPYVNGLSTYKGRNPPFFRSQCNQQKQNKDGPLILSSHWKRVTVHAHWVYQGSDPSLLHGNPQTAPCIIVVHASLPDPPESRTTATRIDPSGWRCLLRMQDVGDTWGERGKFSSHKECCFI